MTAPSIRKVLIHTLASLAASISLLERTPRAKKAAPSDKMFDQMIADYKAALEQGRAALAAPPQDVMEGIARTVTSELEQMHKDGVQMCMREGETTWRTYHAGFDLSMFAQRISDAILASGLVMVTHSDEAAIRADERERCARVAERTSLNSYDAGECRADIAAAIRAGGAK